MGGPVLPSEAAEQVQGPGLFCCTNSDEINGSLARKEKQPPKEKLCNVGGEARARVYLWTRREMKKDVTLRILQVLNTNTRL